LTTELFSETVARTKGTTPANKTEKIMKHYLILALIATAGALAGIAVAGYHDGKKGNVPASA
jgi:hypothetical protein